MSPECGCMKKKNHTGSVLLLHYITLLFLYKSENGRRTHCAIEQLIIVVFIKQPKMQAMSTKRVFVCSLQKQMQTNNR
jgi:hypothetical protein